MPGVRLLNDFGHINKAMKNKKRKPQLSTLPGRKLLFALSICCLTLFGVVSTDVIAAVETSFLYTLSNTSGPIPYNWPNLFIDEERNEIYVVDTRKQDIRIFNDKGMEIYRFGNDGSLGTIVDVAVKKDGSILVLSKIRRKSVIILCNFRGEPLEELELKSLPSDFSDFSPDAIAHRKGLLYLLNTFSMRIVVTDTNGVFRKGYDLGALVGVEEKKRPNTAIGGFSVDREGNILFTIPVMFAAYSISPDGQLKGFGKSGSAPGRFNIVAGIVADDLGNYYVADKLKCAVIMFDKNFTFLKEFGYRGYRPGNLIGPKSLVLDTKGRLYVSQRRNRGISVFQITHKPQTAEQ
jgi:hypothetical protein